MTSFCLLCRHEAVKVSGNKLCVGCYKEAITSLYIGRYPVTSREMLRRLNK